MLAAGSPLLQLALGIASSDHHPSLATNLPGWSLQNITYMWVLAPFLPVAASQQPAAGQQQQQNTLQFLTSSGDISIGRPLKKGGTVGKADILVFNEQSVSTIHAHLQAEPADSRNDAFQHGALSISGEPCAVQVE